MNNVVISGRLTADPELSTTTSGKSFARFTVAVNRSKDVADFIPCEAWESNADFVSRYFHKGDGIEVAGRLMSYKYEVDGKTRSGLAVNVIRSEFGKAKKAESTDISFDDLPFG